jgi:hypothetical protein
MVNCHFIWPSIKSNISTGAILAILAANKNSTDSKDRNGMLPHQKAIDSNLPDQVIQALQEASKEIAENEDDNSELSLHKAI